ncbi:hypothetical protein A7U60_g7751 [Sanghuangporus baumii]|uniref:DUF6533 domain-containing protein n=1 Tax=Sanghuangporus baumii TaxID=108892 RepID=A0A9Q5N4G8_SANBA|nr:hypothetical protein A7U60_g7751 [Sanghuangporus baumii]
MTETRLAEEWSGNLLIVGPQILTTKKVTLGFYTLHLYDHLLTLSDEIEFMWDARVSLASILFFVNRYYSFIFFTISFIMKVTPVMDPTVRVEFLSGGVNAQPYSGMQKFRSLLAHRGRDCAYYISRYRFGITCLRPSRSPPSSRVDPSNLPISRARSSAMDILDAWLPSSNWKASLFQFMQIGYDTIVIAFMLGKAKLARQSPSKLLARMIQDNTLYYAALLAANLTWALMILLGPPYPCVCTNMLIIVAKRELKFIHDSKDRDISFRTMDIQASGIQIAFPEGYVEHTDSQLGDDFMATKKCVSEDSSSFDGSLELGWKGCTDGVQNG